MHTALWIAEWILLPAGAPVALLIALWRVEAGQDARHAGDPVVTPVYVVQPKHRRWGG